MKRLKPPSNKKKGDGSGGEKQKKWFLELHPDRLTVLLGRLFVFAYTWSVGGVLNRLVMLEGTLFEYSYCYGVPYQTIYQKACNLENSFEYLEIEKLSCKPLSFNFVMRTLNTLYHGIVKIFHNWYLGARFVAIYDSFALYIIG